MHPLCQLTDPVTNKIIQSYIQQLYNNIVRILDGSIGSLSDCGWSYHHMMSSVLYLVSSHLRVGCVLIHGWDVFLFMGGITSYPRMGLLPTLGWDHFLPIGGITSYLWVGSLSTCRWDHFLPTGQCCSLSHFIDILTLQLLRFLISYHIISYLHQ